MAPDPSPLYEVAVQFGQLGTIFYNLSKNVESVWLLGTYLSWPFYWGYERCYWAAHYISKADERIESLSWDDFIDSFEGWAMKLLGADWWDFWVLGKNLFRFSLHKIGLTHLAAISAASDFPGWLKERVKDWWGYLDDLRDDPAGWIKGKIVSRFPALTYLFEDPESWVLYMLGVPWFERLLWKNHLFAYLLYRWGLSSIDALMFESSPAFFIRWKVEERWPFLDDLLLDPVGWIWLKWKDSIDRYLDLNLDWLTRKGESILKSIWERRLS